MFGTNRENEGRGGKFDGDVVVDVGHGESGFGEPSSLHGPVLNLGLVCGVANIAFPDPVLKFYGFLTELRSEFLQEVSHQSCVTRVNV